RRGRARGGGDGRGALCSRGGAAAGRGGGARAGDLTADGTGLVALSYRGYGGSSGAPTEGGLVNDALGAYAFTRARYPADRIVLWGESLGPRGAGALAAQKPGGHPLPQSPFTPAPHCRAPRYRFVPVRLLMKDQFHSDLRIGKVTAPVLVLHGERDDIVPMALAERLYGSINAPKRFVRFAGVGHNDLGAEAVDAAKQFIGEQGRTLRAVSQHVGSMRSAHVPRRASPRIPLDAQIFRRGLGECGLPVTHQEIRASF